MNTDDASNGYEAVAEEYMAVRSATGRDVVRNWAAALPRNGTVIDIGAGNGEPITSVLIEAGLAVSAIDAAPTMVAAFRRRFPSVEIACEPVEESTFYDRTFDAALAVGLIFLLPEKAQRNLIHKISGALKPGGGFLFSAPHETGEWEDILTGKPSLSLGAKEYTRLLTQFGFTLIDEHTDEGGTHYYEACKQPRSD